MKWLQHIPPSILYGVIGLIVLWLLASLLGRMGRKQVRKITPLDEVTSTLACSVTQAMALLKEYNGDATRAIMDVKTGRRALPSAGISEDGYAVLLKTGTPLLEVSLAKTLAEASGLSQSEAIRLLTPNSGDVIARGLQESHARAFCQALRRDGLEATPILISQLPKPRAGGDLFSLEYDDESLTLFVRAMDPQKLPWNELSALCVGVLRTDARPGADGTVPAGRGELIAHLYVGTTRYALDSRKFNYSTLGERKSQSSTTNFQTLLQDLVSRAPQVHEPGLDPFLKDLRAKAYRSEEDLASDGLTKLALLANPSI